MKQIVIYDEKTNTYEWGGEKLPWGAIWELAHQIDKHPEFEVKTRRYEKRKRRGSA